MNRSPGREPIADLPNQPGMQNTYSMLERDGHHRRCELIEDSTIH